MGRKFVYPGTVVSQNDGDKHFITFHMLCRLYGLNPQECIDVSDPKDMRGRRIMEDDEHYYPRRDGNYA